MCHRIESVNVTNDHFGGGGIFGPKSGDFHLEKHQNGDFQIKCKIFFIFTKLLLYLVLFSNSAALFFTLFTLKNYQIFQIFWRKWGKIFQLLLKCGLKIEIFSFQVLPPSLGLQNVPNSPSPPPNTMSVVGSFMSSVIRGFTSPVNSPASPHK